MMYGVQKMEYTGNKKQLRHLGMIVYGSHRWFIGTEYGLWVDGPIPTEIGMMYGILGTVKIGKSINQTWCGQCAMNIQPLSFRIKSGWQAAWSRRFNMMSGLFPCQKIGRSWFSGMES